MDKRFASVSMLLKLTDLLPDLIDQEFLHILQKFSSKIGHRKYQKSKNVTIALSKFLLSIMEKKNYIFSVTEVSCSV